MQDQSQISPARLAANQFASTWIIGGLAAFARHWLALVNGAFLLITVGSVLAPWLVSVNMPGAAAIIYRLYSTICHQLPYRSYFLFGYQMAYCERNFAIFLSLLLAGLVYALRRGRARPLDWRLFLLLIAPMAVDGFTQLFGWRESNWQLRTITGALFGVATVGFFYPYIDAGMGELSQELSSLQQPS